MQEEERELRHAIREEMIRSGAVHFGDFILKSGEKSNLYFDLRIIPCVRSLWVSINLKLLEHVHADFVVGVPMGGFPFACSLSYETGIPLLILRYQTKDYGMRRQIEGRYTAGQSVCLIDDVMTTGQSVLEAAKILQQNNLVVNQALVIVDRRNEEQKQAMKHINVVSLFTEADFDGCRNLAQASDCGT